MNQKRITNVVETMFGLYEKPVKVLSEKTGTSRSTISKFYNNKKIKAFTKSFLYKTCIALIAKKLDEEEELNKKFDTLVKRYKSR
mgnify:CR=1 FL=1